MTQLFKFPPTLIINWHSFLVSFWRVGGGKVCFIKVCHSVLVPNLVKFQNRCKVKRGEIETEEIESFLKLDLLEEYPCNESFGLTIRA